MSPRNEPDRDLQALFEALRATDASRTPRFDACWRAASRRADAGERSPSSRRHTLPAFVGIAATLAVGIVMLVASHWRSRPLLDDAILKSRQLQAWVAPTDVFFETDWSAHLPLDEAISQAREMRAWLAPTDTLLEIASAAAIDRAPDLMKPPVGSPDATGSTSSSRPE